MPIDRHILIIFAEIKRTIMRRLLYCVIALFTLIGCSTYKMPVTINETSYVRDTIYTLDSVYIRDSIYLDARGDTVYKEIYKYYYKTTVEYKTSDSVVTDSVPVYIIQEKEVEVNELRWYQQALMYVGIAALCAAVVYVIKLVA